MNKLFSINKNGNRLIVYIFGLKMSFDFSKNNNTYVLIKENGKRIYNPKIKGLDVNFRYSGAVVEIYEPLPKFQNSKFWMGQDCRVILKGTSGLLNNCDFTLTGNNGEINIGKNFSCRGCKIFMDNNCKVTFGSGCMLSFDVVVYATDAHVIKDKNTGELLSTPGNVIVGDNVWLGYNSSLLKNAKIPNNSVVGAFAVVTKNFNTSNIALGGNPAKIIRENIEWSYELCNDISPNQSVVSECR